VDRLDDLGVVDALEVDAGDAEVAVAELALDDDQRNAFARQLKACAWRSWCARSGVERRPRPRVSPGKGYSDEYSNVLW
jgi:hypothetical protein